MSSVEYNPPFNEGDFEKLRLHGICHELLYNKIPSKLADATDITEKISRQIFNDNSLIHKYHIPIYKSHDAFSDGVPSVRIRFIPQELEEPAITDNGLVKQLILNIPEAFIQDLGLEHGLSLATAKVVVLEDGIQKTVQYIITNEDIYEYEDFSLLDFIVEHESPESDTVKVDSQVSAGIVEHTTKEKVIIAEEIMNILESYVIGAQSRRDNTM